MKNFIISIVAVICIQTIKASLWDTCEEDLSNLQKDATEFFTEFGNDLNNSNQNLTTVQQAANLFGLFLGVFGSSNYGSDLEQPEFECTLQQFFTIFAQGVNATVQNVHDMQDDFDSLLKKKTHFIIRHSLRCCGCTKSTGCKAELNQLRCSLSEFFKSFRKSWRQAKSDLRGIENVCHNLERLAKKFTSKYNNLQCDGYQSPITRTVLQRDVNRLFNDSMTPLYNVANDQINNLSNITSNLTAAINTWQTNLA